MAERLFLNDNIWMSFFNSGPIGHTTSLITASDLLKNKLNKQ